MIARVHWRAPHLSKRGEPESASSTDSSIAQFSATAATQPSSSGMAAPSNAPPRLCIGAHNTTAALVPCHSPASALVFGTHDHVALGSGCLAAPPSPTNGSLVTVADCDPESEGQLWQWHYGDAWSFIHSDLCLDVMDGVYEVGTPLQLWTCQGEGHENQSFWWQKLLLIDYGNDPVDVDAITLSW